VTKTQLIDFIHRYYASEKLTALINASLGIAMVFAASILWRRAGSGSFLKGFGYPLIVVGLFLSLVAGGLFFAVSQRSASMVAKYSELPPNAATAQELARLNSVVDHSYTATFWICGALIATGVLMGFTSRQSPLRGGIACGLVLVSLLMIASELYSKQKNIRYLRELQTGTRRQ
jgi:hypothetical protein